MRDCHSRFNVSIACAMCLSQRYKGKEGSQLLRLASRWSLYVEIARSVALVWWNELEGDSGVSRDLFEAGWELVVEPLNLRRYPTVG